MKWILLVGTACVLMTGLILACTTQNVAEQKAQAEALRSLGEAYLRQGKYRVALKQLKKAEDFVVNTKDYMKKQKNSSLGDIAIIRKKKKT